MIRKKTGGYKVVLTADRTLMSDYVGDIFLGFSTCFPRGLVPDGFYFSQFCPPVPVNDDGSSKYAPCGLRKTEAQLLNNGFHREEVIVASPDYLDQVVGENTRVVGINETDPLGIGPATNTFAQLFSSRETYMATKFKEILSSPAVQKYKPRIIVGGPGAWQLEDDQMRHKLKVDCTVIGEGESIIVALFDSAVKGAQIPEVIHGPAVEEQDIPTIQGATIEGIVEIARGCGRSCSFCVPTTKTYRCFSIEHILKEVEVNLRAGKDPLLHSEDVLRYESDGFKVNRQAVKELFSRVHRYPGVKTVGISHFALASIADAPDLIKDLSDILEINKGKLWMSGQCGIETGSPRLIRQFMAGKARPFDPEQWPQVVTNAFQTLSENNWVPLATLIIGNPDETEEDIQLTLDLVNKLHSYKSLLIPLFMTRHGSQDKQRPFKVEDITRVQSELFLMCWEHNMDWAKTLLNEYFVAKIRFGKRLILKCVFNYAFKQTRDLLRACRKEYDCNLPAIIKDAREGKYTVALPIRLITRIASINSTSNFRKQKGVS